MYYVGLKLKGKMPTRSIDLGVISVWAQVETKFCEVDGVGSITFLKKQISFEKLKE